MSEYPFGLCDLHCDTLYEMYRYKTDFYNDRHHISFDRTGDFASYTQVMAIWSNVNLPDDECMRMFTDTAAYARECAAKHPGIALCETAGDLRAAWENGRKAVILAVEGGNLLGKDLTRLDEIRAAGVRFFTLVWGDYSHMGGAHDVGGSLSAFGRKALARILELGIIPDVSHASDPIFEQAAEAAAAAGRPIVATHSNSRAVHPHTRCITDSQFETIRDMGGLTGISFCQPHLCKDSVPFTVGVLCDHIEHFLALGGEKTVCLGSDFDGIGSLPSPMKNNGDLSALAEEMFRRGYSGSLVADIFDNNVKNFLLRAL